MAEKIEIGRAKVAVSLLKSGGRNVFDPATGVVIHSNGWVELEDEDGDIQYYPTNQVGSIQEL
jgi:hypothetical protein